MNERVVVIGAGIAGLCTALALGPTGRSVLLLERDPAPPSGDADQAFSEWNRRGVGHLRHSHAFLARLRSIISKNHPELLAELRASGCRELGFEGGLTEIHKRTYRAYPIDAELAVLTSRRTTLELTIRRYVERMESVTIRSEAFVESLRADPTPDDPLRISGVVLQGGEEVAADVVVDAGGRLSGCIEQLRGHGARIGEEAESAGILYFTRHYRLNAGQEEPPRGGPPATGDLGFMKFGVFPGDNGCFSITICVPEIEMEMRKAIVSPQAFDAICGQVPGLISWIDPDRATAVSRVFGMGDLVSRWRNFTPEGKPAALGFFALGDSLARTNPLYGRGCSFAAVGAYILRDALDASPDPRARATVYQAKINAELRPYFTTMRDQDRGAIRRARQMLTPNYRPSARARVLKSFLEDGVTIAIRSDPDLLRAAMRGFHMLEHPSAWLRKPVNMGKVLLHWSRGKARNAAAYPPKAGPDRDALMRAVDLSPEADILRLQAEAQPS